MNKETLVILQCLLALLITIFNASLQTASLVNLHKSKTDNADITLAKQYLLGSIIAQFTAGFIMLISLVVIFMNAEKFKEHMSKLIYFMLIVSTLIMFTGGIIGASVSTRLQCYRADKSVNDAWQSSSITAATGVLGFVLILFMQAFMGRQKIKDVVREYLLSEYAKQQLQQQQPMARAQDIQRMMKRE
jgi:MFS family permease